MRQYLNWKALLLLLALIMVSGSLFYTNDLAKKLAAEERKKVELVVDAIKAINADMTGETSFELQVLDQNTTIPVIIVGENDVINDYRNDFKNIPMEKVKDTAAFLQQKIIEFKQDHFPLESNFGSGKNYVYYGESSLLSQLRLYPYVQMVIIVLFLFLLLIAITASHRSVQNQVWVGLSKETAHQLGTPLSSITAWLELLKMNEENAEAVADMEKDLNRLQLVADRFSKVGSAPQLTEENVMERLESMVEYMQKRSPAKISITLQTNNPVIPVLLSGSLFDWVIENLIRNALDAMDGTGTIQLRVHNAVQQVIIDVQDSGKGIPRHMIKKVFKPGFTTKKRGWGLGLSLAKRIVEQYHHGSLFVKQSDANEGTTFRIILRR